MDGEVEFHPDYERIEFYRIVPNYENYINSAEWDERREKYFSTHERKCYFCGSTNNVQLHHVTYENLGSESDEELEPLCRDCHMALHRVIESLQPLQDAIEDGAKRIRDEYRQKAYEEIQTRKKAFIDRNMNRVQRALEELPPVIGKHKPHIAGVIRWSVVRKEMPFIDQSTIIKHLQTQPKIKRC